MFWGIPECLACFHPYPNSDCNGNRVCNFFSYSLRCCQRQGRLRSSKLLVTYLVTSECWHWGKKYSWTPFDNSRSSKLIESIWYRTNFSSQIICLPNPTIFFPQCTNQQGKAIWKSCSAIFLSLSTWRNTKEKENKKLWATCKRAESRFDDSDGSVRGLNGSGKWTIVLRRANSDMLCSVHQRR